jgi:hypothetical protein
MGAEPIDTRLDERRSAAGARVRRRLRDGVAHGEHVHAIDQAGAYFMRGSPSMQLPAGWLTGFERRLHGIEVVLAEEQNRDVFQSREVQALRGHALFSRGVSEKRDDHTIFAFHPRRERRADGDRDGAADDGRRAGDAGGLVDEVHRAAARADAAVDAAMHLAEHRLEIAPLGEIRPMRAMAGVDEIGRAQRRATANRRRLLPDDQVDRRLHLIFVIAPLDGLFDPADSQHRAVDAAQGVG